MTADSGRGDEVHRVLDAVWPTAGLELVDALATEPSLVGYHQLPAARGDFLMKVGRFDEAASDAAER